MQSSINCQEVSHDDASPGQWPFERHYRAVPPLPEARRYGAHLRQAWAPAEADSGEAAEAVARALGYEVVTRTLEAGKGGLAAMLVPLSKGRFQILVDPDPSPEIRHPLADGDQHREFRIAHELGHILFYTPGSPPRRLTQRSEAEETFCDEFAAAFLEQRV